MLSNQSHVEPELTVEIDLFSGRPNPQWNPTSQDVANIRRVLAAESGPPVAWRGEEPLGFRGFILIFGPSTERHRMHVHAGLIRSETGAYRDIDNRLESVLIAALPADLRDQFGGVILPHRVP